MISRFRWAPGRLLTSMLIFALFAIGTACDREDDEDGYQSPGPVYRFYVDHGSPYIGAQLYIGDEAAGTVRDSMPRQGYEGPVATYQPGGMESFADRDDIELKVMTPCGERRYGLSAPDDHRSTSYSLRVRIDDPNPGRLVTSTLWLDREYMRDNDITVSVGEREYTHNDVPDNQGTIAGIDCAEEHEVRIDGELVGTIDVAESRKREIGSELELVDLAFFITHDQDACYRMQSYRYRSDNMEPTVGGGHPVNYFEGRHIYHFRAQEIGAFLSQAPTSVSGVDFDFITEFLEISCEDIED